MTKKSVLLIATLSAAGGYVTAQFPALEARAGETELKRYVFSGTMGAALEDQVTSGPDGVIFKAFQHANQAARMNGKLTVGACPIRHLHFRCRADEEGVEVYDWEYRAKPTPRTSVWGETQE